MRFVAKVEDRLDRVLSLHMPEHSRTRLASHARNHRVSVNGTPRGASFRVCIGDVIEIEDLEPLLPHDLTPADIPLKVLYEDDDVLVVNKPRNLATHPAASLKEPSLVNALLGRGQTLSRSGPAFRPGIVHRLDKATTGLLMIAKTESAHQQLSVQIQVKTAERRYLAIICGRPTHSRFDIDAPLGRDPRDPLKRAVVQGGKHALTQVKLISEEGEHSLVAVRLVTGRTHQIRAHLASVGHPIAGDVIYGGTGTVPLQLHAAYISFTHPSSGERIVCFEPPPDDFVSFAKITESDLDPF